MKAMVTGKATGEQMRWNFGDSRDRFLSLDEFLAEKEAEGVQFFDGKEPLAEGYHQAHLANSLQGLH